jgi:hypothetical protein
MVFPTVWEFVRVVFEIGVVELLNVEFEAATEELVSVVFVRSNVAVTVDRVALGRADEMDTVVELTVMLEVDKLDGYKGWTNWKG